MATLKPLLRKTIWREDSKKSRLRNFNYKPRSIAKVSARNESMRDGLMEASYLELGPPGTNRDVYIAADIPGAQKAWLGHEANGIVKTETFGQDVTYLEREGPG
ncbi:MAG: hypothetical protein Q9222_001210, partial [Ikaeria aurantiellina]